MVAITPVAFAPPVTLLRTGAAQATTGQTDWISVPPSSKFAVVFFNLTANAGTTPISTVSFLSADPTVLDDANTSTLGTGAAITAAPSMSTTSAQVSPGSQMPATAPRLTGAWASTPCCPPCSG